jgi:YVTN family beta-propeller protein
VAVNPVTHKLYVANYSSNDVTVIEGASNSTTTVSAGTKPQGVAVNPVTHKAYVANYGSTSVTVITPARMEAIPLTTDITPLPGDATWLGRPTFSLSATSTFSPTTPAVRHIYYQVDTWIGPWLKASPAGASGSGRTPTLLPGTHLLFAFAVDGQEATSINTGQGSSPIIGQISVYHFLMNGTPAFVPLALKRY